MPHQHKKSIFNWNITNQLKDNQIDELKSYYRVNHQKCWALKKCYKKYLRLQLISYSVFVLIISGGIASAVATSGISLIPAGIAAFFIMDSMKYQSLDTKIQNCKYAFESYNNLLVEIKHAVITSNLIFFETSIHDMNNINHYVTNNCPIVDQFLQKYNEKFTD